VDEVIGKQQVVVKGLGGLLKDLPGVAGGAVLSDGRVGMILDLESLLARGARL
jgi:two-component system chemotaxis sensor kinase CheA